MTDDKSKLADETQEALGWTVPTLRTAPTEAQVEAAVENAVVRITEAAIMTLDADEDNTVRLEAFARGIRPDLAALAAAPGRDDVLEHILRQMGENAAQTARDYAREQQSLRDENARLREAGDELRERGFDGEFYVQGDKLDLVFRPGGGSYCGADQVVARMACGETAHWLPSVVAELLNAALNPKEPPHDA